ncbi:MAG: hypothetical protein WBY53_04515 [Acidobacteriaceae bacterium]
MGHVRPFRVLVVAALTSAVCLGALAQGDPGTLDQEKLVSQIKLTKATDDRSDIVTSGDIVLLNKDGLMMCSSNSSYAFSNTYSNGVLAANYNNRAKDAAKSFFKSHLPFGGGGSVADAANNGCSTRKFVAGEKFWITHVDLIKDGILVTTFSDPYPDASGNQVRYYGQIKFPFPDGHVPAPDAFMKTVSEVFTVQPADDSNNSNGGNNNGGSNNGGDQGNAQPAPTAAPAPPPAPMAAIPPPPPPADTPPPTIALGQTELQVTTAFGQPTREVKLGTTKKIFYYKDMKVTFVHGKVTDVE